MTHSDKEVFSMEYNLEIFYFATGTLFFSVGDISPTVVAGGMKVALITTIFGLIVALILQVFYNYILSKIEALTSEMEDSSISLLDMVIKYDLKYKK